MVHDSASFLYELRAIDNVDAGILGDANGDGEVTISDAVGVVNMILSPQE